MRNKRFLALILSMAMTMSLFGCGGEASQSGGSQKDGVRQEQREAVGGAEGKTAIMPHEGVMREEEAAVSADRNVPQMSQSTAGMKNDLMAFAAMEDGTYLSEELPENWNTEEYSGLEEPGFASVASTPLSTFSADVDTASYSNIRRMIEDGYGLDEIPAGAVRIEEMLNYFSYDYKLPGKDEPFGVTTVIGDCPWNEDAKLLQIGLKTQKIDFSEAPASNLVFLLDVSGSMYSNDKLPLLQKSFSLLAEELTEKDTVSIVTYAGSDRVVLKGESGDHKEKIIEAINGLEAGGSTNGADGIETAYALAEEYFIEGGNNRVILATDGDLNVGVSSESDLKDLVTEKRKSGVFLSVLGFGTGNIKDNKMEALADNGNGNYAYIDSISEAKKVLVDEMGATLVTVAKDVKLQVEFNPAYIKGYRLLGYENRALAAEDFEDDKKDAGEIGAGHTVTALYEIVPVDSKQEIEAPSLKYRDEGTGVENGEWLNVKIRYKEPEGEESLLKEYPVTEKAYRKEPSQDFYFAAAVAEFGLLLRDSEYKGSASFDNVKKLLKHVDTDNDDYKDEFSYLVKKLEKTQ
ncbi:MAG: VWA domain-containing protein [Bacteroidales bacterium]|nr:VWA domain-containing protein [Lachnoclostridium sp.]MCM1383341.1 VWA domain-containing protein [Lachnoclostridium sp.]MCM1465006.1 VWA domain-containing protein [Bacteroidales bacterium]